MRFKGCHFALGVLLLGSVVLLAFSTSSLIRLLRSHYHRGLNERLCKCERLHGNRDGSMQARVVNGSEFTSRRGLSWVASLYTQSEIPNYDENGTIIGTRANFQAFCTAVGEHPLIESILSSRHVLTAAHCVEGYLADIGLSDGPWVAAGADHDLRGIFCKIEPNTKSCDYRVANNYTKKVVKIHLHPKYPTKQNDTKFDLEKLWQFHMRGFGFDIAILEVQPFTLSEELNILPGCLFESNGYSFGDRLLSAGYGLTEPVVEGPEWARRLMPANQGRPVEGRSNENETVYPDMTTLYTTQLSQTDCEVFMNHTEQGYRDEFRKSPYAICVRNPFSSMCYGDSGGALMYRPGDGEKLFIVGVTTMLDPTSNLSVCLPNRTNGYTRIYTHLNWIRGVIGDERCITNQIEPQSFWAHLQAVAWPVLSICLVSYLIVSELKKPRNAVPSK